MIDFSELKKTISGEIFDNELYQILYSTDASVYKEKPLAVIYPRVNDDIPKLIRFARKHKIGLIPRTAGTSLAGQVVGNGIVVDFSKYLNKILEINHTEHWVRVEPGVILDELNRNLKSHNLFFGPETSSSNRCMIGGMVGNNACGAHSLIYGSTRDHLISVKCFLSDGNEVEFKPVSQEEFFQKLQGDKLENKIYQHIYQILGDKNNQNNIINEFPDHRIRRRNTGYAIDILLNTSIFGYSHDFNFAKLIAGSEGTLCIISEIKLNLLPLPPPVKALLCVHLKTIEEAFKANLIALKYNPGAVELMDKPILDLTKNNIKQNQNRFFIEGDPGAILIIEFASESLAQIEEIVSQIKTEMLANGLGYHFPLISGNNISKVWELRKAGLGVLSNMPGDAKPVSVIEDTCVLPEDLPNYINDLKKILTDFGLNCVYHAHIGTGELHIRPVLNLKNQIDINKFHNIALETAKLVKKYKGSLSGEHGDGRLRGQFLPIMLGENNYQILQSIKSAFDPYNIFNPGKITGTVPMNSFLRFDGHTNSKAIKTYFDFDNEGGITRLIEKCNGSADCRKTEKAEGIMCPAYMVTLDEKNTTRGRANLLRELLYSGLDKKLMRIAVKEILDLCISCKACKSECPSGVDMAKIKSEFLQHWYNKNGISLQASAIGNYNSLMALASKLPDLSNFLVQNNVTSSIIKSMLGFSQKRKLPAISKVSVVQFIRQNRDKISSSNNLQRKAYFFADEFTNYNDSQAGIKTIKLLHALGYTVEFTNHCESGRALISKGMLKKAAKIARKNVHTFYPFINENIPLICIEPSAILCFRDEYLSLLYGEDKEKAKKIAPYCLMIDEFIDHEIQLGKISHLQFKSSQHKIKLHGHCHQRSIASIEPTINMLKLCKGIKINVIPSGCCGMAGSFGYEKNHYEVSMKIGELVLFPAVRNSAEDEIIMAPGISCRTQIFDGTGRKAIHPIEFLFDMLTING